MPLLVGTRLGPYEILSLIGAGGMGEVYKARDTRLGREVAIKISAQQFSQRFECEARAVAALNHPNICQLYDVETNSLVMEYVDGVPITAPDSPRKLLDLAVQIADGMAAAHAAGIIHRDLKPDNILVTREGRVKILDFGLAKVVAAGTGPADATLTAGITDPGTTIGTIAYMSPEQARGNPNLTTQSDQFSFGLILYELIAGKRAFQRSSAPETMTAIIREDADPLPASTPAPLRWIVERLLSKEPAERYDSTRDLYRDLRQIRDRFSEAVSAQQIPVAEAATQQARVNPRRVALMIAALAVAVAATMALTSWLTPSRQADLSSYKFTSLTQDEAQEMAPVWSPDGKSIAYDVRAHGIFQIAVKSIASPDSTQLTHAQMDGFAAFWSRDSTTVYYISGGGVWAISASGGTPELILDKATGPALHPDGKTIAFARDGKVWIGALKGGPAHEFWRTEGAGWLMVGFSPDGSKLAVIDLNNLWIAPYPSGTPRKIGIGGFGAGWFPDSRHVLVPNKEVDGFEAVDTLDGSRRVIYRGSEAIINPSVSPDGKKIAYAGARIEWDVIEISVPDGRVKTVPGGGGNSMTPEWAPSGTHYLVTGGTGIENFVEDRSTSDGFVRRVADNPPGSKTGVFSPRWSPDGTRFSFVQWDGRKAQLTIANASGSNRTPIAEVNFRLPAGNAWSPDGQWIAFVGVEGDKERLFKVRPAAGSAPEVLPDAAPDLSTYQSIQWSPKGDWILYPGVDGMSMISPNGKTVHKLTGRIFMAYSFTKDGGKVYGIFRNSNGEGAQWQLYSVDVNSGAEKILAPLELPASTDNVAGFSIHPDGKRFLTSIAKWPYDIWMLEGFEPPRPKTWLERLLRR